MNPPLIMTLHVQPSSLQPAPPDLGPSFVVGQDAQGRWLALEDHGLAGGIFRDRQGALRYAAFETDRRPDAVRLSAERLEFRLSR